MSRRLLIVIVLILSVFTTISFASANKGNSKVDFPDPPVFTSTPPSAPHPFSTLFTYNFSATDDDGDMISFKFLGNEQLDANYQDSYNWATGYGGTRWQSFTAVSTGILTKAGVLLSDQNNENVTVTIYSGVGTGGDILYQTTLAMYNMTDYWEITIPESSNILVTAGSYYTIAYSSESNGLNGFMKGDGNGPLNYYNGGSCDFTFGYDTDYSFRVHIKPFTTTSPISWLSLTDNNNGTGTLSGTPTAENVGEVSLSLYANSLTDYVKQTISFTVYDPTPSAPTGLFGIAGNGSASLKWNKNPENGITKYYIYGGTEEFSLSLIDSTNSNLDTTKTFTELTNNTQYFYQVKALSNLGLLSNYSAKESLVPTDGFGNAIELNGAYQYVSIPGITELTGNSFTLEAWAKRYSTNTYDLIFGQGGDYTSHGLHVGFRDSGVFTSAFYADDIDTEIGYPELNWVHWAVTYDASTNEKKIYRNGVLVGSGNSFDDFLGTGSLFIGMSPWYSDYFHGQLDEARIWNYVRSESEIADNRLTPLTGEESGLIGLYHFDETGGETVYDATKYGRNGAIVNSANFVMSQIEAPEAPAEFEAHVVSNEVVLTWSADTTGTFNHFVIYRSMINDFGNAEPIANNVTDLEFADTEFPTGDVVVYYWISAVNDKNMEGVTTQTSITVVDDILRNETFDGAFPPLGWTISNPDDDYTWELYDGGLGGGQEESFTFNNLKIDQGNAAVIQFYDYDGNGATDTLKTKPFKVNANDYLKFDLMYRGYAADYVDEFHVVVSTDGGATFGDPIYAHTTHDGLRTVPGYYGNGSTPVKANYWRTEGLDLSDYANQTVVVGFVSITGYGNNLYIDNVEASAIPARPARLFAKPNNGTVELIWNSVKPNNFKTYHIYAGMSPMELEEIGTTAEGVSSDTTFVAEDLELGTLYYFAVAAENQDNETGNLSPVKKAVPVNGFGTALALDGQDGYAQVQNEIRIDNSSFTIEAWAKRYPNGNDQYIFGLGIYTNVDQALHVGFNYGNNFLFNFYNDDLATEGTFTDTTWHHWAVTLDYVTKARNVYLDGELIASNYAGNSLQATAPFLIGAAFGGIQSLNGYIDEVRVWDYARTETQIYENRNMILSGGEPGLMATWHFDEATVSLDAIDGGMGNFDGELLGNASYGPTDELYQTTLPVELSSFTAQSNNGTVQLNWSTASESNNAGWEVEVSLQQTAVGTQQGKGNESSVTLSGVEGFTKIGFIAGKGTTTERQNYQFQVESSKYQVPSLQFRLKQIDLDGKFSYSNILAVSLTPNNFGLAQNYPNPFNPVTVINYQLQSQSDVKLVVFDMLGREVATLVNEKKETGSYSATFNGENLTSGVYFYKLTAGSFSMTKKMTLIK